MFGGDAYDEDEAGSLYEQDEFLAIAYRPRPHRLHVPGSTSSRASVASLQEAEHGWSGSAAGVRHRPDLLNLSDGGPLPGRGSSLPDGAGPPPTRKPYRPPFAPSIDLSSVEDLSSQPAVPAARAATSPPIPSPPLTRGRSIKDKVGAVLSRVGSTKRRNLGRSKSLGPRVPPVPETPPATELKADPLAQHAQPADDVLKANDPNADAHAFPTSDTVTTTTMQGKESWAAGIVRRVSRRATGRRTEPTQRELDRFAESRKARISTYNLRRDSVANIKLYAAPSSANVPNAPALSSYAPRAPLRPRASTTGSVPPVPPLPVAVTTVGAAAAAYNKDRVASRANTTAGTTRTGAYKSAGRNSQLPPRSASLATHSPSASEVLDLPDKEDVSSSATLEAPAGESKRVSRRTREVPAGWQVFANGVAPEEAEAA